MNPSSSDIPEPIRHWLSTDHRNCRRQKQLADILDVIDLFVPMSIDRGHQIGDLLARVAALETAARAEGSADELVVLAANLRAAMADARAAWDELRVMSVAAGEVCPYLVG